MVQNKTAREIARESFEYGHHAIDVMVWIESIYLNNLDLDILNHGGKWDGGRSLYRRVQVRAIRGDTTDVKNTLNVDLEPPKVRKRTGFFSSEEVDGPVTPLDEQIRKTIEPVLEELDRTYRHTERDYSIDIEVTMDRAEAETSWVDVPDETERISREIDKLAGRDIETELSRGAARDD